MIELTIPPIRLLIERDPATGMVAVAVHDAGPDETLLLCAHLPVSECTLVHGDPLPQLHLGPFGVALADEQTAALCWNELGGALQ